MKKIYIVEHCRGMDGDYVVAVFSKEEDAQQLATLYNSTDNYGTYDYYSVVEEVIDEVDINDYYLHTEIIDDSSWTELRNANDISDIMEYIDD